MGLHELRVLLVTWMPWGLSAITIWMNVLAGNERTSAWAVGLVGQLGWSAYILALGAWGLLPLNAALWFVYTRNLRKWQRRGRP